MPEAPSLRQLEAGLDARRLRRLAVGLLVYGLAGLATLALIAYVGARSIGGIEPLATSLESERVQLGHALRQTSAAIRASATATSNAGTSLVEARDSAGQAAALSRSVAATMRELATASDVSILGSQPLAGLGQGFGNAATQADDMGTALDGIGTALAKNGTDIAEVRTDLDALAAETDSLAQTVEAMPPVAGSFSGVDGLRWAFLALGAWLAVPALAALAAGWWLWSWLERHEGPGEARGRQRFGRFGRRRRGAA